MVIINPDKDFNQYIEEEDILDDFSYLDEDDVYEEYYSPNGEIEIDEDEDVEIIEAVPPPPPPHPFGFPPPPPPRSPFGFSPPSPPFTVPPIQEIEIEEVETDEIELDYTDSDDEVLQDEQESFEEESTSEREHRQTYAQMNTAQAHALASAGVGQSELIKREMGISRLRSFFKVCTGLVVFSILCGLCYIFIHWNHLQISHKNEMDRAEYNRQNIGWRLPESNSNNLIKRFFECLGPLSEVSGLTDMLIKGTIEMKGLEEDFYCIRRANGTAYIKIGTRETGERAYFIGDAIEGVSKLIDLRTSGERVALSGKEALVLRSLVFFDEQMFKFAFLTDMRVIGENVDSFKYFGRKAIDSVEAEILASNKDQKEYSYAFSSTTGELISVSVLTSIGDIMIKYSDYQPDDSGIKMPFAREVYLNGNLVAKVKSKIVFRNKGFIFP